jgi:hypothetical protein
VAFDGFMCINGVEVVNSSRLAQLIAAGRGPQGIECRDCAPCPDLDKGLGYPFGYNPANSPWYDPAQPESIDFAGLLVTSVVGLGPGEFTRTVTETAGVGAIIGQGRNSAPVVTVTGLLMAATCCAMEYGLRWLSNALRAPCAPGAPCSGGDLLFLSCEPEFPDLDCLVPEDDGTYDGGDGYDGTDGTYDEGGVEPPFDYEEYLAPYYRALRNAALISGPTVTSIVPRGCPECYECGIYEVTFTVAAGDPCVYWDPIDLASDETFDCSDEQQGDCIEWVTDPDGVCDDSFCDPQVSCAVDPNCVDVSPPSMPSIPNPCVEECIGGIVCRVCVDIPEGTFPATGEGTLRVEIFAGDTAMRRIQVRIWENPLGLDPVELDDCDVCTELNISYVGPDATLVIDGASRSSTISCPGGATVRANQYIANASGGSSFQYPSLSGCGGLYTVCVSAEGPVSELATVSIQAIPREC